MINGKRYAWEDITIRLPYAPLIDVDSIEYSDKKEYEAIYGKGSNPVGYGAGNYSAEGKITMLREEFNKLIAYAKKNKKGTYNLAPFTAVVSYSNEDEPVTTDTLKQCKFTEQSLSAAQGDKSVKVELSMLILGGINWNGMDAN
jgi:hypothetical protein